MRILYEADDAVLKYDDEKRIFKFIWNGVVSHDTLKPLVLTACRITENIDRADIIFDRRKLESYSPDARIWLKHDFMKNDGKRLMKKIHKIAAINSSSSFAQVVSTVLVGALKFYNKDIKYKIFEDDDRAMRWISGQPLVAAESSKWKGWFSFFR